MPKKALANSQKPFKIFFHWNTLQWINKHTMLNDFWKIEKKALLMYSIFRDSDFRLLITIYLCHILILSITVTHLCSLLLLLCCSIFCCFGNRKQFCYANKTLARRREWRSVTTALAVSILFQWGTDEGCLFTPTLLMFSYCNFLLVIYIYSIYIYICLNSVTPNKIQRLTESHPETTLIRS